MKYIKIKGRNNENIYRMDYFINQGRVQSKLKLKEIKSNLSKKFNKEFKDVPTKVWIEPTNICNLKCIMCPTGIGIVKRKKGFMDFELYKKIIDEVSQWKARINLYHMGESLLHKQIFNMIKYAKEKECGYVQLVTNGTMLDEETSLKIINSGLDIIQVSFDGATKETYEKIRRNSNFDKVLKNIKDFIKLKKQMKKKKPYLRIQIIDMEKNREELVSFAKLFKKIGVEIISTKKLMNWAGSINMENKKSNKKKYTGCLHPWNYATITWEGEVVPCCRDFDAIHKLGNLKEKSLKEIWNNDRMKFLRKSLETEDAQKVNLCKGCDVLYKEKSILR